MPEQNHGEIIVYQSEDGIARVDVLMENETVWLSKAQMAELFQRDRTSIGRHISAVFQEGELDQKSNVQKMHVPNSDKLVEFYSLEVIIAVGYRVKSQRGTQFRQWATARLKEYIQKGFTLDDERLKGNGGGNYWKELLARIRDIRSSEKMLYRQVLDLYATSLDYDPHSEESVRFFQIVQNKLHYAAHGHTAAEVIYQRADADQPFMGLRTFSGDLPVLRDVGIAKNYLDEQELRVLNNLVSGYFDIAEIAAIEHRPMYMRDYIAQLDAVLSSGGRKLLDGAGNVSHQQAMKKAQTEYRKYQAQTLSPVEEAYLETVKSLEKSAKKKSREKKQ
ncbi:MAG: virulence RhuM family protein [Clostridia bacterium]|nr:virulence RhuM family protein [Clostridia bacterium]